MRDVSSVTVIEEAVDVKDVKEYGIGLDVHKLSLWVSVRTKQNGVYLLTTAKFPTDWNSILLAKEWCYEILRAKSDVMIDPSQPLHYVIESTATYHCPICIAWGGTPSVINPTLAGAAKRKTDRLDAKRLALHDQTAVWRESYIVPPEVEALRLMIAERDRYVSEARVVSTRINNALTKFGYNLGREGSVTSNSNIRAIIENQISDSPDEIENICPIKLPMDVRLIIREEYAKHDYLKEQAERWKSKIIMKASSMQWPIAGGKTVSGAEMIAHLTTVPQIGELSAIIWLANVADPNRFRNSRALSGYCALDPTLQTSADKVSNGKKRGGRKVLHQLLCNAASQLIRRHREAFGQWGYRMYKSSDKWKKASNAVARKLCVAMYQMMMTNTDFSYESYQMMAKASSFSMPVEDLPMLNSGFSRYIRILNEHDIHDTEQMITAYLSCKLGSCRGLGQKFFTLLRDFTENQSKYHEAYKKLTEVKNDA